MDNDKPLNYRQSLFAEYYTSNPDTQGNCEASMLKAGYKAGYARKWAGSYIGAIRGIKEAIADKLAVVAVEQVNSREFVTTEMMYQYNQHRTDNSLTAIRALENLGKNVGWYEADNQQKQEQTKLDAEQQAQLERYKTWCRNEMLKGA